MPGTPMAKSASLFSANSLTCRGDMTCSASDLRSSGRIAAAANGASSPWTRSVGGRPTLRCRSDAFCFTISCKIALKLNAAGAPPSGAGGVAGAAGAVLAIGVDSEKHLSVLHRVRVLDHDVLDHPRELRFDLVHDLHRFDDADHLAPRDALALRDVRFGARLGRGVERSDHRRLDLQKLRLRWLGL